MTILVAEPTVSEQRAVLNNPAGAVETIKRQQAEIANLREQLRTAIPAIETLKRTRDELQAALGSNAPELPSRHPDTERLDYLDSRLQLGHRFTMGSYPQPDIEAKTIRELIDKMRGGADEPAGGCIHCGGEHE